MLWKTANLWEDNMKKNESKILIMAFCGAVAASFLQRCVLMLSLSQRWCDRDRNGFAEKVFLQNFRMSRATLTLFYQLLSTRALQKDTKFRWWNDVKVIQFQIWLIRLRSHCKNSGMYDWTTCRCSPNLDLKDQISCDYCCSHCHGKIGSEKNRSASHMRKKKVRLEATFACHVNIKLHQNHQNMEVINVGRRMQLQQVRVKTCCPNQSYGASLHKCSHPQWKTQINNAPVTF